MSNNGFQVLTQDFATLAVVERILAERSYILQTVNNNCPGVFCATFTQKTEEIEKPKETNNIRKFIPRNPVPGVTAQDVAHWYEKGLGAGAISSKVGISEGVVRKHLVKMYGTSARKLG